MPEKQLLGDIKGPFVILERKRQQGLWLCEAGKTNGHGLPAVKTVICQESHFTRMTIYPPSTKAPLALMVVRGVRERCNVQCVETVRWLIRGMTFFVCSRGPFMQSQNQEVKHISWTLSIQPASMWQQWGGSNFTCGTSNG